MLAVSVEHYPLALKKLPPFFSFFSRRGGVGCPGLFWPGGLPSVLGTDGAREICCQNHADRSYRLSGSLYFSFFPAGVSSLRLRWDTDTLPLAVLTLCCLPSVDRPSCSNGRGMVLESSHDGGLACVCRPLEAVCDVAVNHRSHSR